MTIGHDATACLLPSRLSTPPLSVEVPGYLGHRAGFARPYMGHAKETPVLAPSEQGAGSQKTREVGLAFQTGPG